MRAAGRIVSVAVTIAVAVNTDGRREAAGKPGPTLVVGPFPDSGMAIGVSEAETFWVDFLRTLKRRGLAGAKLVLSDAHEGIKAAVTRVLRATRQRCRVHFMRNALAHAGKSGRRVVSAFIATAFAQDHADAAKAQWRQVADQVRPKLPKLAARLDEAEEDGLAYVTFPKEHRAKIHSTNPLERVNGEVKRRTEVVGIFPNEAAITRLVGAILPEQNDESAVQRARYMSLETVAPLRDDLALMLPAVAACTRAARPATKIPAAQLLHHLPGHDPAHSVPVRIAFLCQLHSGQRPDTWFEFSLGWARYADEPPPEPGPVFHRRV